MRFEVRFSIKIKAGDRRASMLVRPWLNIDFEKLGEAYPRSAALLTYIWNAIEGVTNPQNSGTEEPS